MAEIGVGVLGCGYMGRAEAVVCSKIEGMGSGGIRRDSGSCKPTCGELGVGRGRSMISSGDLTYKLSWWLLRTSPMPRRWWQPMRTGRTYLSRNLWLFVQMTATE